MKDYSIIQMTESNNIQGIIPLQSQDTTSARREMARVLTAQMTIGNIGGSSVEWFNDESLEDPSICLPTDKSWYVGEGYYDTRTRKPLVLTKHLTDGIGDVIIDYSKYILVSGFGKSKKITNFT